MNTFQNCDREKTATKAAGAAENKLQTKHRNHKHTIQLYQNTHRANAKRNRRKQKLTRNGWKRIVFVAETEYGENNYSTFNQNNNGNSFI